MDIAQESFVAIQFGWALFARMTPSFAHGGATKLLGTHNTLQLSLAHVIVDLGEARTSAVIFNPFENEADQIKVGDQYVLLSYFSELNLT